MEKTGKMKLELKGDREIVVTRKFEAPRELVFRALTEPELLLQWMWGPDEWPLTDCRIDLRVGGELRYEWKNPNGGEMGLSGVFREIDAPERIVHTEIFDEDWTGGETVVTTDLSEQAGVTTMTMTVRYASEDARKQALQTPMEAGMAQTYERLDGLLRNVG